MTAVAALVDNGTVWIGADSAASDRDHFSMTIRKDEKVFRNGNFLIGGTTSFRMLNLLRYTFMPPGQPNGMSDAMFMNTLFIDAVRSCFDAGGFLIVKDEQEEGGDFIVGYKGQIYEIQDDFQVSMPMKPYEAVGCGGFVCLGSLYSTLGQPPQDRIRIALEAAEQHSAGVRGPFNIMSM